MTEQLTDEERDILANLTGPLPAKALRILDAHAAERAALVRERDDWETAYGHRDTLLREVVTDRAALVAVIAAVRALRDEHAHTRDSSMFSAGLVGYLDKALAGAGAPEIYGAEIDTVLELSRKLDAALTRVKELEERRVHVEAEWLAKWTAANASVTELRAELAALRETSAEVLSAYNAAHSRAHAANARIAELQETDCERADELEAANARAEAAEHASACHRAAWDAADERCKHAESEAAAWKAEFEAAERDRDEYKRLWRIWEPKCQHFESEAASLRAENANALRAYDDEVTGRREEVTRCHAEMGKLRAEVERLRALASTQPMGQGVSSLEIDLSASLAAATELLRTVPGLCGIGIEDWQHRRRAFLANAPAAPTRTECESPRCPAKKWEREHAQPAPTRSEDVVRITAQDITDAIGVQFDGTEPPRTDHERATRRCPVHDGQVHGGEAEELRHGLETMLADDRVTPRQVQELLDRVDARDSLAHGERTDHECAVLEACAAVHHEILKHYSDPRKSHDTKLAIVCDAELARREAAK